MRREICQITTPATQTFSFIDARSEVVGSGPVLDDEETPTANLLAAQPPKLLMALCEQVTQFFRFVIFGQKESKSWSFKFLTVLFIYEHRCKFEEYNHNFFIRIVKKPLTKS